LDSRRALGDAVVGWLGTTPPPRRAAFTLGDVATAPPGLPLATAGPDDVAYILFTRGTSGPPKGVPTTHRMAARAVLHQIPDQTCADSAALAGFSEERRLTMWCSVPLPIRCAARFRTLEDRDCSSLRHVAWCGDVLPPSDLLYWRRRLPNAKFTNLYGSSETIIASSYYVEPRGFSVGSSVGGRVGATVP